MEVKRLGKLLSGEEIINYKSNSLKDLPSGCKDYEPNNSWLEQKQIQAAIETHHILVGSERIEKKSNLSTAIWNRELGKAKVTKKTGKYWDVFGHSINSEDWLHPEEALFLLETNALELYSEEVPLSVEQTYALVIGEKCRLSEYRVYSHLSKKGYRVLRHDKNITRTSYERDLRLDQMTLAQKRLGENVEKRVGASDKPDEDVSDEKLVEETTEVQAPEASSGIDEQSTNEALLQKCPIVETNIDDASDKLDEVDASVEKLVEETTEVQAPEASSAIDEQTTNEALIQKSSNIVDASDKLNEVDVSDEQLVEQSTVVKAPEVSSGIDEQSTNEASIPRDDTREKSPIVEANIENESVSREAESDNMDTSDDVNNDQSPDLVVVEGNKDEDIIEIDDNDDDDDDDDESSDDEDIEITEIRSNQQIVSVNLIDSDEEEEEEDDVIFISQKRGNDDPSKWRKWFLTEEEFVEYAPPTVEPVERTVDKSSKIKLIDCFDLANKHIDTIMRAIPSHQRKDSFINSPDQRFIPTTILPRYSQYKINLFSSVADRNPTPENNSDSNLGSIDTSFPLSTIAQHNCHDAKYSYSYHRTRNHSGNGSFYRRAPRKPYHSGNYNGFARNRERTNFVQNNFENNDNYRNNFNNGQIAKRNWVNCQTPANFQNAFNFSNSFNNGCNNSNPPFNLALQQVQQMQMLAMTLMQTSQALMQQCSGGYMNQMGNSFNDGGPSGGYNNFNRGHRPYRRPYRRRGGMNRMAVTNYTSVERQSPPRMTPQAEIVSVDDDEVVKPGTTIKRVVALGAIACLNAAKRTKFAGRESVVKIEKPIKTESPRAIERQQIESRESRLETSRESDIADSQESQVDTVEIVDLPPEVEPPSEQTSYEANVTKEASAVQEIASDSMTEFNSTDVVSIDSDSEHSQSAPIIVALENADSTVPAMSIDEDSNTHSGTSVDVDGDRDDEQMDSAVLDTWESYKMTNHSPPHEETNFKSLLNFGDQRASISDVLTSLQIFKPIDDVEVLHSKIKVTYDIYLPNQPFRKSVQMVPNYRIVISESQSFPSILELNYLQSIYKDDVPFLYSVVDEDSIRFYRLFPVNLPTLDDDSSSAYV